MSMFDILIVTPEGPAYAGQCEQATLPGADGTFGVLANHMNIIASLTPGAIVISSAGTEDILYFVSDGIAEVSENSLSVLVENATSSTDVDKAKLNIELVALESALAEAKSEVSTKAIKSQIEYIRVMLAS